LVTLPPAARAAWSDAPIVLGLRERDSYVRGYANILPACRWANRNLPADARVLFGLDTRTFFLEREAYWSNCILQRRFRFDIGTPFLLTSLKTERIEYLIINRTLLGVESVG